MGKPTRVYVVDDHWGVVCEGLRALVPPDEFEIVEPLEVGRDLSPEQQVRLFHSELERRTDIDVVLLDIMFGEPGRPLGRDLVLPLYGMGYPTIVMSATPDTSELVHSANIAGRGDFSFVRKNFGLERNRNELMESLQRLSNELRETPPYFRDNLVQDERYSVDYDRAELSSLSTLFAIRWENSLVLDLVQAVIERVQLDSPGRGVRILDIGCGTGRFEELLLAQNFASAIECVEAIDYSPGMLTKARERLPVSVSASPKVRLRRRLGERLFLPEEIGGRLFDVVLMGFGVPSFVKDIRAFLEVQRVLAPGGKAMFTTYNRDAAVRRFQEVNGPGSSDVCAVVRQGFDGRWEMGPDPYWIRFNYFSITEFLALLRSVGFVAESSSDFWSTFPALVTCIRPERLGKRPPTFPENISYLDEDPLNIGFDHRLYESDLDYCRVFRDQGYYLNVVVAKEA